MAQLCVYEQIALAEETLDGYDGDSASKEEELFGVPHIVIDCADCDGPIHRKILDTNRLPSTEDVSDAVLFFENMDDGVFVLNVGDVVV